MSHPRLRTCLTAGVLLSLAPLAHGTTLYVANDGSARPGGVRPVCGVGHLCRCGAKASPCRSIACGITSAAAGDTIVVGPGVYGDLNHNGTLGDLPGEENPDVFSPGCGCVLALNKRVSVESSNGAAATIIDGQSVDVGTNVLLITGLAGGGEFGKPGKGFTVTNTGSQDGTGIMIDATNVTVAGNQVVSSMFLSEFGIRTVNADETVRIEGNQVI